MSAPRVIRRVCAGRTAPDAWAALFPDALPHPRRLAALDAIAHPDRVELLLPRYMDHTRFRAGATLWRDGKNLAMPELASLPGGARLIVPGPGPLTLRHAAADVAIDPVPPVAGLAGQRVLLTIPDGSTPEQIATFARYHVRWHSAQALCLIRRIKPLDSNDFSDICDALADSGLDTLALFDVEVATGHPASPARSAQFFAPDGPGKALRTYERDPWHAPLDEIGLMEAVRRSLLDTAASVLFCEVADLMLPPEPGTPNLFERAEVSETYLRFRGRFAYPWRRAEPQAPARHEEHGAVSFDGGQAGSVWCVAPQGPLREASWRPYRISMSAPDAAAADPGFWRCAAVLHPGEPAASLAPKSSLVADPELTDFMATAFDHTPERPPEALAAEAPAYDPDEARVLIVTTMKNEGPFILEWLAWHRAMGVTDFLVYTNDCTDGTDTMFDLLHEKGIVEHRENPYRRTGEKPQHAAYHDAEGSDLAQAADWVICMDVDEFINVHVGEGRLPDLFRAAPDATMIALTWRLFGNAEVIDFEDRFITEQFFRCAPQFIRKPHQAWGIKTLFRPLGHYKKFGVHRPKGLRPECLPQIRFVNGSGQPMPEQMLRTGWRSTTSTYGYDLVTLNHYALRSAESYLVKRDRGRVNHVDRDQGMAYWFRMNNNAEEDRRALDFVPAARAEFDRLMSDPQIAAQHHACVAAHRARIEDLKARPDYVALLDEITGDRLIRLSRMHHAFGSAVFLAGPDIIPPGVEQAVENPRARR